MNTSITAQQVWEGWSGHLVPHFQQCEKKSIDTIIQDIIVKYASDQSIHFQKQLTDLLRFHALTIIDKVIGTLQPVQAAVTPSNPDSSGLLGSEMICTDVNVSNTISQFTAYKEYTQNPNYLVYSDGSVYSKYSKKFLSPRIRSGYYAVSLQIGKAQKTECIHRLVAIYFVINLEPVKYVIVNHKDGNKLNNNYLNLEWVTRQDNASHAVSLASYRPSNTRSVHQINIVGDIVNTFSSISEASRYTEISQSMIGQCCNGNIKRSFDNNGTELKWQFVEETKIDVVPIDAKAVREFENYLITIDGKVYSLKTGKYMSQVERSDGYLRVGLQTPTRKTTFLVHKLVADAYLSKDNDRLIVNHKDSNRKNNHVSNLEYVTPRENSQHSYEVGKSARFKKLVKMIDPVQKKIVATFPSVSEASRVTRISKGNISQCCCKKSRLAGGYLWQFDDEIGIREVVPKITPSCPVEKLDPVTGEIVESFRSMTQAAESIEGDHRKISEVCSGKFLEYKGWAWRKSSPVLN